MKLLKLEFYKCRRRKILLICAAALGMELLWMGVYFARMEPEEMTEGWMLLLYNLSMVDSIILPLGIATLASRNCELEHKGNTWKLLETMTSPGGLYAAKICWGALILGGLLLIRLGLFLGVGIFLQFSRPIPWSQLGFFTLLSWGVSLMLYTLQQGLSLYFANQAVPLIFGISGSFLGLLSLLFPQALIRCVPWGYYGLMSLSGMDWDPVTRVSTFYWIWPLPVDLALLLVWTVAFLVLGRALFVKKEV